MRDIENTRDKAAWPGTGFNCCSFQAQIPLWPWDCSQKALVQLFVPASK